MKRIGYLGSGQYYCNKCKEAHNVGSNIGKKHIKYANDAVRKGVFKKWGFF